MSVPAVAAFGPVGVVADPDEAVSAVARVHEAVGAGPENGLVVGARAAVQLVVVVAELFVGQRPLFGLAVGRIVAVDLLRGQINGGRPHGVGVGVGLVVVWACLIVIVVVGPLVGGRLRPVALSKDS